MAQEAANASLAFANDLVCQQDATIARQEAIIAKQGAKAAVNIYTETNTPATSQSTPYKEGQTAQSNLIDTSLQADADVTLVELDPLTELCLLLSDEVHFLR